MGAIAMFCYTQAVTPTTLSFSLFLFFSCSLRIFSKLYFPLLYFSSLHTGDSFFLHRADHNTHFTGSSFHLRWFLLNISFFYFLIHTSLLLGSWCEVVWILWLYFCCWGGGGVVMDFIWYFFGLLWLWVLEWRKSEREKFEP